jgi:hypothetical protein
VADRCSGERDVVVGSLWSPLHALQGCLHAAAVNAMIHQSSASRFVPLQVTGPKNDNCSSDPNFDSESIRTTATIPVSLIEKPLSVLYCMHLSSAHEAAVNTSVLIKGAYHAVSYQINTAFRLTSNSRPHGRRYGETGMIVSTSIRNSL